MSHSRAIDREVPLLEVLVPLYTEAPVAVANLCDEVLDRSGRLLGEVRAEALVATSEGLK